jgi:hypothetical protein
MKDLNEFTDNGKDIPENKGKVNWDDYFGDDSLVADIFDDVKEHYRNNNSRQIFNYKLNSAELVLPNIYRTNFNTGTDTISDIKNKGEAYFKEVLEIDYAEDKNPYDIKLTTAGNREIYVKFVSQLPSQPENPNIFQADQKDGNEVSYRLDDQGNYLYMKPKDSKVLVKNGIDIVYINVIAEDTENVLKRDSDIKRRFKDFIESIRDVRSIVPIMNETISNVIAKDGTEINFRENILKYYSDLVKVRFLSNEVIDEN